MLVCNCCGRSKNTNGEEYFKIDRYYNKPIFNKKTTSGLKVVKETVYSSICENCNSLIIEIHTHALNRVGKKFLAEKKVFRGKDAIEYYNKTIDIRVFSPIESPYNKPIKSSKTIPFIYGKTIDKTFQQAWYIDDSSKAGNIEESIVKKSYLDERLFRKS